MMVQQDFPLFPLGIVALPSEAVPLHIFEARYRTMIAECLETGSEFGIVWAAEDGLRQIGCACEIAEVLERHEDGRMDILTRGTRPFRLVEAHDDLPYPAGTVEWLDDKAEQPDDDDRRGRPRGLRDARRAGDRQPSPSASASTR